MESLKDPVGRVVQCDKAVTSGKKTDECNQTQLCVDQCLPSTDQSGLAGLGVPQCRQPLPVLFGPCKFLSDLESRDPREPRDSSRLFPCVYSVLFYQLQPRGRYAAFAIAHLKFFLYDDLL